MAEYDGNAGGGASAVDNFSKLGVGIQRAQERFEREGLPFAVELVVTADGGAVVYASFMLADMKFPLAWDADADFRRVDDVVEQLFSFAADERETSAVLEDRMTMLKDYLEEVRAANPEIDEWHNSIVEARADFEGFVENEVNSDRIPRSKYVQ